MQEDKMCGGNHPNQSCIAGVFHMVFSRRLTNEEWAEFADAVDQRCWNPALEYWEPECIAGLAKELFDITVVKVEFTQ